MKYLTLIQKNSFCLENTENLILSCNIKRVNSEEHRRQSEAATNKTNVERDCRGVITVRC